MIPRRARVLKFLDMPARLGLDRRVDAAAGGAVGVLLGFEVQDLGPTALYDELGR
jgi:hypothetical protein